MIQQFNWKETNSSLYFTSKEFTIVKKGLKHLPFISRLMTPANV